MSPRRPHAGRLFSVRAVVVDATGARVSSGRVTCRAAVSRKVLHARSRGFARSQAFCLWRLPARTHGRRLSGSIRITAEGVSVTGRFSARIR
jgi:hypothetical protein